MLRRLPLAVVSLALLAAACSDPAGPTPPAAQNPTIDAAAAAAACPNDVAVLKQIIVLFPSAGGLEAVAEIKFLAIRVAMALRKPGTAQTLAYNLTDWTLKLYADGRLAGGKSALTQSRVATLVSAIYCAAGLPDPALPPSSLGTDGAVALIMPATTTPTTVVTPTHFAGITVAGGSVTQPTLITVTRLPDTQRLLTPLDQYPLYYQFTASPALPFGADAVVGVCIANTLNPPDLGRLRVAHNVPDPNPTTIEILPLAPAPFLDCTNATLSLSPHASFGEFAMWGLGKVGHALARAISPTPLFASYGAAGLGGTTRKLSPFGVVDTLLTVTAVSSTSLSGSAGAAVAAGDLPRVRVATPLGLPVVNYPVTFSVPSTSQGTITGGSATTDANGQAAVTSWTLGADPRPDSVFAQVAPPHLNSGVQGSPVLFIDNVIPPSSLSYQASGYRYLLIGNDAAPTGWEQPAYLDQSWSLGSAAFGSGPGSPNNCSLDQTVQTLWPAATTAPTSDLLVRHTIGIPAGFAGSLQISVGIDNDIQVFVNGHDITASGGTVQPTTGFLQHEGCATLGSAVFTAPASILLPGQVNVIAVHARDRAGTSFLDLQAVLGQ